MTLRDVDITPIVSFPFEENSFIVRIAARNDCLVLDPGLEPGKIIDHLDQNDLRPAALLITHGHCDHIAGAAALKKRWPECPLVIGKNEAAKLSDPMLNLSAMFGQPLTLPPADVCLSDGELYESAGFKVLVHEIPGHSTGHVVFEIADCSPRLVFVGDVIFAGSVGRTDFPDGSFEQLAKGIRAKLFNLPEDTILFPGHGASTTVGEEQRTNPFVGRNAG
jgi:hydroxyacylglutathione hydrolase